MIFVTKIDCIFTIISVAAATATVTVTVIQSSCYQRVCDITIAADFAIEIRRRCCDIFEFGAQSGTLQQLQIAGQTRKDIVNETNILAGCPDAGAFVVIQFGVLIDICRVAVFHLDGEG